ncbi:hypothetical protein BJX64DRAFT_293110 [Aspergillus heterothallicus]
MALCIHFLSSALPYNALPHISEASDAPSHLQDLRSLLIKHQVPKAVCIRLIHKHFGVNEGEAMVTKSLDIPDYGAVSILCPADLATTSGLHGVHYMVDAAGHLQAYEYLSASPPNVAGLAAFSEEFSALVVERGLENKFGLKITSDTEFDQAGWTEIEFAEDRRTIMIPRGFPTPDGDYELTIETEFHADPKDDDNQCGHTRQCTHCSQPSKGHGGGLFVGGRQVDPEAPFYSFFNAVVEVW